MSDGCFCVHDNEGWTAEHPAAPDGLPLKLKLWACPTALGEAGVAVYQSTLVLKTKCTPVDYGTVLHVLHTVISLRGLGGSETH